MSRTAGTATSAAAKTERLLNLVIALLYTRRPLAKAKIREAVPQYATTASPEAFDRMFERDKDELRELGIPLLTEPLDPLFDDEPGYRIDRRDYALPEISFAPDELAVLGLASRAWAQASLAGPAAQALRKLEAAGVERDDASLAGIEPRVSTAEPAFEAVRAAVVARHPVRFSYRASGSGLATTRHIQPWALVTWRGRWYVTGYDTGRAAPRVFRLSRIEGTVARAGKPGSYDVPEDHEPRAMIRAFVPVGEPQAARLRVRDGSGHTLRRRAARIEPDAVSKDSDPAREAAQPPREAARPPREAAQPPREAARPPDAVEGWSVLTVMFLDVEIFADEVSGFGADVLVLEPAALRAAVVSRLQGALRMTGPP